ncbi:MULTISPECIES: hypothetical protein [unclassified Streptomyces]|uniref:hypothetical protein n=1 Tax=unclassified Streptomyces TaxID=2593676 RepID=UPI003D92D725
MFASTHPLEDRTNAATLLRLPAGVRLSKRQEQGADCAWCGITLSPATVVDLGVRRVRFLDDYRSIFPQGCRRHAGEAAYRALFDHAPDCEACIKDAGSCEIGVQLQRLIRECRRWIWARCDEPIKKDQQYVTRDIETASGPGRSSSYTRGASESLPLSP